MMSYEAQKFFILKLIYFSFVFHFCFGWVTKKAAKWKISYLLLCFPLYNFLVLTLTLRAIIPFWGNGLYGVSIDQLLSLHVDGHWLWHYLFKKNFPFPIELFGTLTKKNQLIINMRVCFWALNCIPLIYVFLFTWCPDYWYWF